MSSRDIEPDHCLFDLDEDDLDQPEDLETVMQMMNMKTVYKEVLRDEVELD